MERKPVRTPECLTLGFAAGRRSQQTADKVRGRESLQTLLLQGPSETCILKTDVVQEVNNRATER